MRKKTYIVILLSFLYFSLSIFGDDGIRDIRDNTGYFWNKVQMARLINYLKKQDKKDNLKKKMIAGISPHDDYLYAAKVYYKLFKNIKAKEVVIFGVTHSAPRKSLNNKDGFLIFDDFKNWKGILKPIEISPLREELIKNLPKADYIINKQAHMLEHSIEGMLPFLQYYNKDIKITPIMVTGMEFEKMKKVSSNLSLIISKYIKKNKLTLGKDIFFLISSDSNHYGKDFNNTIFGTGEKAHTDAVKFDIKTVKKYLTGLISEVNIFGLTRRLWGKTYKDSGKTLWCGRYSIPFGMLTVLNIKDKLFPKKILNGQLLKYSDSYSNGVIPLKKTGYGITAPFSLEHWVGYFSAGFYIE